MIQRNGLASWIEQLSLVAPQLTGSLLWFLVFSGNASPRNAAHCRPTLFSLFFSMTEFQGPPSKETGRRASSNPLSGANHHTTPQPHHNLRLADTIKSFLNDVHILPLLCAGDPSSTLLSPSASGNCISPCTLTSRHTSSGSWRPAVYATCSIPDHPFHCLYFGSHVVSNSLLCCFMVGHGIDWRRVDRIEVPGRGWFTLCFSFLFLFACWNSKRLAYLDFLRLFCFYFPILFFSRYVSFHNVFFPFLKRVIECPFFSCHFPQGLL